MNLHNLLEATIALFIIIDPLGNLPIFIGLTGDKTKEERKKILKIVALTALVLLLIFTFAGTGILKIFKITISDFKIAGGLLLLAISLKILIVGYVIPESEEIGVVPLACPLLVGPGAITTTMVFLGIYGLKITLVAILISFLLTSVILNFAENIYNFLGKTGALIISKIVAILISAIAVQYIRSGIEEMIK